MIDPNEDGVTHINIYSKGKTELGRLLSNFAYTPVDLGPDGKFNSLEGYWYWLSSKKDKKADELRKLYGWQAKALGRKLKIPDYPEPSHIDKQLEFMRSFKYAMYDKLTQTPGLTELLKNSTLQFKHYYVYGGKVIDETENSQWMIEFWEYWRDEFNE